MPRTPSAERIIAAATEHFALRGYDGGSLAEIAATVGIRKPSLYAHFAGKDELFREAYADAIALEREIASGSFPEGETEAFPGVRYLESLVQRYPTSPHLRLFLRTSYMPPASLQTWIDDLHESYLDQLREAFIRKLGQAPAAAGGLGEARATMLTESYLGIVDSVQVKLIYTTPELAGIRLKALGGLIQTVLNPHPATP